MILGVMALVGVVVVGAWYFVNKDDGRMEKNTPVAVEKKDPVASAQMENKETSRDMMGKTEAGNENEGTLVDKTQDEAMMKKDTPAMEKKDVMMGGGQYVTYAPLKLSFAKEGKVVLFFRAGWCPTCRALDGDIRSHLGDLPKDVLILDVDYDTAKELKQKYGVTYQHTLVQVDETGNMIAKWSGSEKLSDLLSEVK